MKRVLVVIDMQNDFITGSLGTKEAQAIVMNVVKKISAHHWDYVIFTQDTHFGSNHNYNYEDTLEGKKLPVAHCLFWEKGWQLETNIQHAMHAAMVNSNVRIITKPTFGTWSLLDYLKEEVANVSTLRRLPCEDDVRDIDVEVEICGLCTDICVISNALLLRAAFPNMKITCDSSCCAGVTPEKHAAALEVMRSCQIDVI